MVSWRLNFFHQICSPFQTSIDSFAGQLEDVVTAILDKFAPLKTITHKAGGKPINRFLSQNAKEAKKKRRRLERCWKRMDEAEL